MNKEISEHLQALRHWIEQQHKKGVKSTIDPCQIIGKIQNSTTKGQRQT